MLSKEQINLNVQGVKKQLSKFLDFDSNAENAAVLVNNIDWFTDFTFLDFIRDVGKYITVNYMMSKDSVKKRLETGMSFTEFTYQLVQGYDFFHLYQTYGIKLQMGGSDQWGNIVTGTELIRKKIQGEAFAFTAPLIKKADGGKFGKTESGNVWLDASKTSPYSFYQFWLNTTDEDAEKYIKIFTFLTKNEIDEIIKIHTEGLHLRTLQKRLAKELTCMVHSEKDYEFAVEASKILFGDDTSEALKSLNENELLDIMDGVPRFEVTKNEFENGISMVDLLVNVGILPSKSEAKKMIQSNAISLNKIKNGDINAQINSSFLLNNKYLLIQKGKKNYYLVIAV
jgi:tyrosyl-tRNA synthetase